MGNKYLIINKETGEEVFLSFSEEMAKDKLAEIIEKEQEQIEKKYELKIKKDRKLGYFRISQNLIENTPFLVKNILSKCIVLKAHSDSASWNIKYLALCDEFDDVEEGNEPVEYSIDWKKSSFYKPTTSTMTEE